MNISKNLMKLEKQETADGKPRRISNASGISCKTSIISYNRFWSGKNCHATELEGKSILITLYLKFRCKFPKVLSCMRYLSVIDTSKSRLFRVIFTSKVLNSGCFDIGIRSVLRRQKSSWAQVRLTGIWYEYERIEYNATVTKDLRILASKNGYFTTTFLASRATVDSSWPNSRKPTKIL